MGHWFEYPFAPIATPTSALPAGQKPDVFDFTASDMALIYVQAPYVQPQDQQAFCGFADSALNSLDVHHRGEEEHFSPWVEKASGEPGIMETNVKQHHVFHDGLMKLAEYIKACMAGSEKYDGKRIVELMDDFRVSLNQHLNDEIQTLLDLRKYGPEKMKGLHKEIIYEGQRNMNKIGLMAGLPQALFAHDRTFEGGLWADFPPAPWIMLAIVRNVLSYWHASWWKFSPCTTSGQPRPLPYARPEAS